MKILFLCTAHNSLSQRLFLELSKTHSVCIEYALSDRLMIEAVELATPDLIICPFLTVLVPKEIYNKHLTLIIHPGPPGDAGPSALDWVLMGDDGSEADAERLLQDGAWSQSGRTHWGVTVLQAIEEFDAGPVWAFEQFPLNIDAPEVNKSSVYRGPVTRAAIAATLVAIERIQAAVVSTSSLFTPPPSPGAEKSTFSYAPITTTLTANPTYRNASVGSQDPFLGGTTRHRPLLKAAQRDFNLHTHTAREVSRRIRSSDSQPGCLSKIFGPSLYVYGGIVEEGELLRGTNARPGEIIAVRDGAVCVATCNKGGVWITHVRRLKRKIDPMLWPKVTAVCGLLELGVLSHDSLAHMEKPLAPNNWSKASNSTHQEIWIEFQNFVGGKRVAFLYFDFYNGAMSTNQCSRLIEALDFIISTHTEHKPLTAVVLMGGDSYFSNGIALNIIEAARDPSAESWLNINRIDDVVQYVLQDLPSRNILTIACLRGNCAAGGVALATACDIVIAGSEVVLNPAYRAVGLHGSEYHSISYGGRCGPEIAKQLLRSMVPLSPSDALTNGLIDHILSGSGTVLDARIHNYVRALVCSGEKLLPVVWKSKLDISPEALARARAVELCEMAKDFWSARSERYHKRRQAFVRKTKASQTPLRFATHRRNTSMEDEEDRDEFDSVELFEKRAAEARVQQLLGSLQGLAMTVGSGGHGDGDEMKVKPQQSLKRVDSGCIFPCYYGD